MALLAEAVDLVRPDADDPVRHQHAAPDAADRRVRGLPGGALHHDRGAALGHEHEPGADRRLGRCPAISGRACGSTSSARSPACCWRSRPTAGCAARPTCCAPSSTTTTTAAASSAAAMPRAQATATEQEPPMSTQRYDVIIVGSGAGGAAAAYKLARAGKNVLMLEKGKHLPRDGSTLDTRQVFKDGKFKNREEWSDGKGGHLMPDEHYNVGGKTKWYGAALLRFSAHEFAADPGPPVPGLAVRPRRARALVRRGRAPAARQPLRQRAGAAGAGRPDRQGRLGLARRSAAARPQARDPRGRAGGQALRRLRLGRRLQGGCRAQPDRRRNAAAELHAADQEEGDRAAARAGRARGDRGRGVPGRQLLPGGAP